MFSTAGFALFLLLLNVQTLLIAGFPQFLKATEQICPPNYIFIKNAKKCFLRLSKITTTSPEPLEYPDLTEEDINKALREAINEISLDETDAGPSPEPLEYPDLTDEQNKALRKVYNEISLDETIPDVSYDDSEETSDSSRVPAPLIKMAPRTASEICQKYKVHFRVRKSEESDTTSSQTPENQTDDETYKVQDRVRKSMLRLI